MHRCFPASGSPVATSGLRRGELHGRLDAGRRRDSVWTTARVVDDRCRHYLVADLDSGRTRLRFAGNRNGPGRVFWVDALSHVDRHKGLELSVLVVQGASTSFVKVVTIRHGRLLRMRARGPGSPPSNLFAFGGSAMHNSGVDCALHRGPGWIVVGSAIGNVAGTRMRVVRRFFVARHHAFVRRGPAQRLVVKPSEISRFPEFHGVEFRRCTVMRQPTTP